MYNKWIKNSVSFVALTGFTIEQFKELLPYFEDAHQKYFNRYELGDKKRKFVINYTIYSNSPLPTVKDRLAFILSYKKLNPIQEQQAAMFNMTQKQCNQFIHSLTAVLEQSLEDAEVMPCTTEKELARKLTKEGEIILMHDGTEREIPRPIDDEKQKENYSGKKKKHTLKNGIIATMTCYILFVGATVNGSTHDKKIADNQYGKALSESIAKIILYQDTGFQGFTPKGVEIIQPFKKPKGIDFTDEQKKINKNISSIRVRVEHAIGSAKRYRIVKDECRLRKNNYPEKIFKICAALHNFRIKLKPFNYPVIKLT